MTAQDHTDYGPPSHFLAAPALVRPLYRPGIGFLAAAVLIEVLLRAKPAWLEPFVSSGIVGLAAGASLLAAFGLLACLRVVLQRQRRLAGGVVQTTAVRARMGWVFSAAVLAVAVAVTWCVVRDWPASAAVTLAPNGFVAAAGLLLLATPCLLTERHLGTIRPEQLPEVGDLRALVFLPVFYLAAEAVLQIIATLGVTMLGWVRIALDCSLLCVCIELCLRASAQWFLPPKDMEDIRAPVASVLAGVISGRSLAPARLGSAIRTQFGMDFSRSWALRFMRAASLPVFLLMLGLCWFLTGVTRVDLNERGSYERLGVPVAMLGPGLHLVLPWPFGVVRHVEYGVIHAESISYDAQGAASDVTDHSTAEGEPPMTANRLWDSEQPSDVSYIIASGDAARQSFETVSASVRVLYRVGLNDAGARDALYATADQAGLLHVLAGRLLSRFFTTRTLPDVLGENQGEISSELKTQLQSALDALHAGTEVVSVVIEAVHPPAGAASAYRAVQAAEIAANTEIANETGRAQTTKSVAERTARSTIDDADGNAAETVSGAQVDLIGIEADDRPFRADREPFLLERYFSDIRTSLKNVPMEIIDHRLNAGSLPTIDLRPLGAAADAFPTGPAREGTRP
jgi:regulator of protease activity HflC (stomatin/prohibitin superfamily)